MTELFEKFTSAKHAVIKTASGNQCSQSPSGLPQHAALEVKFTQTHNHLSAAGWGTLFAQIHLSSYLSAKVLQRSAQAPPPEVKYNDYALFSLSVIPFEGFEENIPEPVIGIPVTIVFTGSHVIGSLDTISLYTRKNGSHLYPIH
jgi:hypothetical protein